mgnify:CR=1 FL=1
MGGEIQDERAGGVTAVKERHTRRLGSILVAGEHPEVREKVFLLPKEVTRRTGNNVGYIVGACIDVPASQDSRWERAVLGTNLLVRTKRRPVPAFIPGIAK